MCRPSYNFDGDRDDGGACGRRHTRSSEALRVNLTSWDAVSRGGRRQSCSSMDSRRGRGGKTNSISYLWLLVNRGGSVWAGVWRELDVRHSGDRVHCSRIERSRRGSIIAKNSASAASCLAVSARTSVEYAHVRNGKVLTCKLLASGAAERLGPPPGALVCEHVPVVACRVAVCAPRSQAPTDFAATGTRVGASVAVDDSDDDEAREYIVQMK